MMARLVPSRPKPYLMDEIDDNLSPSSESNSGLYPHLASSPPTPLLSLLLLLDEVSFAPFPLCDVGLKSDNFLLKFTVLRRELESSLFELWERVFEGLEIKKQYLLKI